MSGIVLKRKEHGTKRKHQEMSGTVGARLRWNAWTKSVKRWRLRSPRCHACHGKEIFEAQELSEEHGKWESLGFLGVFMGIIVYLWKWWETTNMLTIIEGFQGTVWNDFWNLCWDIKRVSLFANNIWSLSKHEMKSSTKQVGFPTN